MAANIPGDALVDLPGLPLVENGQSGLFICRICKKNMIKREPKDLPCGHTFCLNCIKGLSTKKSPYLSKIKCPDCDYEFNEPYKGVESLPDNVSLIFMGSTRVSLEIPNCKGCALSKGKRPAKYHCSQCDINMCENCEINHKIRFKESHELSLIQKTCTSKCNNHGEPFKYYCIDCLEMVCPICVLYDVHMDHKIKPIEEYCEEFKDSFPYLKTKLNEKYKEASDIYMKTKKCEDTRNEVCRQVEETCNSLKSLVDCTSSKLLSECSKYSSKIKNSGEKAGKIKKQLKDILSFLNKNENPPVADIVSLLENILYTNLSLQDIKDIQCFYPVFEKKAMLEFGDISWVDITNKVCDSN